MAKNKEDKKVLVTFELDNDLYFKMLKHCYENRVSIDEFVESSLKYFLIEYGKKKKST